MLSGLIEKIPAWAKCFEVTLNVVQYTRPFNPFLPTKRCSHSSSKMLWMHMLKLRDFHVSSKRILRWTHSLIWLLNWNFYNVINLHHWLHYLVYSNYGNNMIVYCPNSIWNVKINTGTQVKTKFFNSKTKWKAIIKTHLYGNCYSSTFLWRFWRRK